MDLEIGLTLQDDLHQRVKTHIDLKKEALCARIKTHPIPNRSYFT